MELLLIQIAIQRVCELFYDTLLLKQRRSQDRSTLLC